MSVPELRALCHQLHQHVEGVLREGGAAEVPAADLRALVSAVVRLYAAANEGADEAIPPLDADVATTDAVVLATALLKAHDLTPFDLALWFNRSRVAG
jgi:hypothetical protein